MGHFLLRVAIAFLALHFAVDATASDWITQVRTCVERKDFACARSIVDGRLQANPSDLEAQTWRARLLAWSGAWTDAERQYEAVLAVRPADADVLLGLADVQLWSGQFSIALQTLDKAENAHAPAPDLWLRRARAYVGLHQQANAVLAYRKLLQFSPSNQEAMSAVQSLQERRHQLRIGSDTDVFNYTDAANAESVSLDSRWSDRWSTHFSTAMFQRFGEHAETADLGVTYRFNHANWVTVMGGGGNRQDIAPQEDLSYEYGHGTRLHVGPIGGLESYASFRNLWYSGSQVFMLGTTQVVYLPHALIWTIRVSGVRSTFGTNVDWVPAGFTRLAFPVTRRVEANGLFAVGAENFSNIDQIGHFSAHTYGGGAKVQLNERQDISAYIAFQQRTQGRTQTSIGVSYGIRF